MTTDEYRKKRQTLGLTQPELAERLGVSRATIARREAEGGKITEEAAIAIEALTKRAPKR